MDYLAFIIIIYLFNYLKPSIMLELTVESSNPTKNDTFCNKLVAKTETKVKTAFGQSTQNTQLTYYLFTDVQNKVGQKGKLDLNMFDVVEKPFIIDNDGVMETIQLKYLYLKR